MTHSKLRFSKFKKFNFRSVFGELPDTIEFSNFLLQLKNQRSGSKTVCGIPLALLGKWTLRFSSDKNCKLKAKLWWVEARESKKREFFVTFILSEGNFFNICVLSQCIVYWINFQYIHFCYLFSKSLKAFSLSLKDETRILLLWDGSLVTLTLLCSFIYSSVMKPVHIFIARNRASESCLISELCFCRFVHFVYVPMYIFDCYHKEYASD